MNESDQRQDPAIEPRHATDSPSIGVLQGEVRFLRTLLVASLMALVVFGLSLDLYVFRQVSILRKELDAANAALQEYQAKREPLINSFVSGLQEFSRSHPDLIPILERYGASPASTLPSASPLTPPAAAR